MTSMAFILGTVPLVVATGAGATSRHSIGTGVLGGMLAATFLAIFFVPLFFVLVRKISGRISGRPGTPAAPSEESRQEGGLNGAASSGEAAPAPRLVHTREDGEL